jgi:hypothetical protein
MFLFYTKNGAEFGPQLAVYQGGGIQVEVPANEADKPAELAAAITALNAAENGSPVQQYTTAFLAQRKTLFTAFRTFHEAFRTASASPTLAEYRSALGSTLTVILTLPATFTDELAHEQAGLGLPGAPTGAWTLAQCQGWHTLLSGWLGRAMAGVAGAMIGQLD